MGTRRRGALRVRRNSAARSQNRRSGRIPTTAEESADIRPDVSPRRMKIALAVGPDLAELDGRQASGSGRPQASEPGEGVFEPDPLLVRAMLPQLPVLDAPVSRRMRNDGFSRSSLLWWVCSAFAVRRAYAHPDPARAALSRIDGANHLRRTRIGDARTVPIRRAQPPVRRFEGYFLACRGKSREKMEFFILLYIGQEVFSNTI